MYQSIIFRITTRTSDCGYEAVEAAFFGLHGNAAKRAMRRIGRSHNISISGSVLRVSTSRSKICEFFKVFFGKDGRNISLQVSVWARFDSRGTKFNLLHQPTLGKDSFALKGINNIQIYETFIERHHL